jgi:hypothetical protein
MRTALALCLVLAPAPGSAVVTLAPTHDTYVNAAAPDVSYGNAVYLSAENNASTVERSYLEFDTSGLSGQTVTAATLRIWVIRDNAGGGASDILEVYPVYSAWTDALTYNQSLSLTLGAMAASMPTTDYPGPTNDTAPPQAVDFDVTALVQSWVSGATNEGVMIQLSTSANADYRFASLENSDPTLATSLTVTTSTAAPPPPGPTPPPAGGSSGSNNREGDEGLCGALGMEAVLIAALLGFTRRRVRA